MILYVYKFTNLRENQDHSSIGRGYTEDNYFTVYEDPNHKGKFSTSSSKLVYGNYQKIVHTDDDGSILSEASTINQLIKADKDAGDEQGQAWVSAGATVASDLIWAAKGVRYAKDAIKEAGVSLNVLKEIGKNAAKLAKPSFPKEKEDIPGAIALLYSSRGDLPRIKNAKTLSKAIYAALNYAGDIAPVMGSLKSLHDAIMYNYKFDVKNLKN